MNRNFLLTLLKGSNTYDTVVKILNLAAGFLAGRNDRKARAGTVSGPVMRCGLGRCGSLQVEMITQTFFAGSRGMRACGKDY